MLNPNLPEQEILKEVLQPLLEDFQYWFNRSRTMLETEDIPFLDSQQQANLLERLVTAQQEVSTAQLMFQATEGKAGVELEVLLPWHHLLTECW
ncbi:MAG: DUF2605 domain-containing protein, partial [Coleofasciculaceae cyanobacterium SM2_3_26]|nr:DUF2605 domain-containing protein [Coleofasciculaceae cyanobacterium SM2_3_26]